MYPDEAAWRLLEVEGTMSGNNRAKAKEQLQKALLSSWEGFRQPCPDHIATFLNVCKLGKSILESFSSFQVYDQQQNIGGMCGIPTEPWQI